MNEDFQLVQKMLEFSQVNMEEAEAANLKYEVVKLQELRDDLPKIKRFQQDMIYLKHINIDTVYDNFYQVFSQDGVKQPEGSKQQALRNMFD